MTVNLGNKSYDIFPEFKFYLGETALQEWMVSEEVKELLENDETFRHFDRNDMEVRSYSLSKDEYPYGEDNDYYLVRVTPVSKFSKLNKDCYTGEYLNKNEFIGCRRQKDGFYRMYHSPSPDESTVFYSDLTPSELFRRVQSFIPTIDERKFWELMMEE